MALLCIVLVFSAPSARAQFTPGSVYWYVPENEKYAPTKFYKEPRFSSPSTRVSRAQRFRLVAGAKGWLMVEFDIAGTLYVPIRLLRLQIHDPGAGDPWQELKRASVFSEDPARIEARLRSASATATTQPAPSSVPSWKRYKEGWNVKPGGRSTTSASMSANPEEPDSSASAPSRGTDKKVRSKYPLLPPIGSDPARERAAEPGASEADDAAGVRP